jgi:cobalamin-dependent methionine synthase I
MMGVSVAHQVTVAKRMEERKLKLPLLIGGATTSKMHTAVKLVTQYSGPVVHVLDASRSVPVAQTLLDKTRNVGFVDDIREVGSNIHTLVCQLLVNCRGERSHNPPPLPHTHTPLPSLWDTS